MSLILVRLEKKYENLCKDMLEEWIDYNNSHKEEGHSPWVIFKTDYSDFDNYIKVTNEINHKEPGFVPNYVYFTYDTERNLFVGAVDIREYLTPSLYIDGGHIGDGVRPSERGKGYGTKQIALALEKCRELKIYDVLIVCDKNNIASVKTVTNNGGILENEVEKDGKTWQRYWVKLNHEI